MNIFEFAPKQTTVTLASQTPIENGEPIRIWGIIFNFPTTIGNSVTLEIQSADGTVTYFVLVRTPGTVLRPQFTTPFIADKGLRFVAIAGDAEDDLQITVYHSQVGS